MNKKAIFIFFLCFFSLFSILSLNADQRIDNIEIYLVFDKSLSMVEEIDSVKNYVIENILDRIVIEGDYFLLIPFYGTTDDSFNGYISSNTTISNIRNQIQLLEADGRYTDIGNALNTLKKNIKSNNDKTRKYMLLITDGKQEAPPDSPYYSPDGSFNHEFLKNTKEIQKQGWKIIVLGIGNETDAEKIAKELSAGYTSVSNSTSSQVIDDKIDNFLGRLDLIDINEQITLNKEGNATINLEIESTDYEEIRELKIIAIKLVSETLPIINILDKSTIFKIENDKVTKLSIPVSIPVTEEDYPAEIIFVFEGENSFSPAVHTVNIKSKKGIPFYFYIIIIAIVLSIFIYYIFIIIQRKKMEDEYKPDESI
ncbi:MAG: VWA domain-containing protein [Spirochaetales bacterium]|nr:VWA domain-containing protein [Spirochaetales bacterium]